MQRLRTVRPTVADRQLQNLERLMQAGRSSSNYPRAEPDFALRRAERANPSNIVENVFAWKRFQDYWRLARLYVWPSLVMTA